LFRLERQCDEQLLKLFIAVVNTELLEAENKCHIYLTGKHEDDIITRIQPTTLNISSLLGLLGDKENASITATILPHSRTKVYFKNLVGLNFYRCSSVHISHWQLIARYRRMV
jgi:hypothetical protein